MRTREHLPTPPDDLAPDEAAAWMLGAERGDNFASCQYDGNTRTDWYRAVIEGYDEGDPVTTDLCPAPLSGEWAGESIPELLGLPTGADWPDDDALAAYEDGFALAFWSHLIRVSREHVLAAYGMRIERGHFTGEPSAVCESCGWRIMLWESFDDWTHDCPPAMSWSELADLTHDEQVATFGFCGCEDGPAQYDDCPPADEPRYR